MVEQRKVRWEKVYGRKGLRKVKVVYARFQGSIGDGWPESYGLYDDGVFVDSVSPSAVSDQILQDFLDGLV